jgi:hypothetical protein
MAAYTCVLLAVLVTFNASLISAIGILNANAILKEKEIITDVMLEKEFLASHL